MPPSGSRHWRPGIRWRPGYGSWRASPRRSTPRRRPFPRLLPVELAHLAQAVEARLPPIAAETHRREPAWRDGLTAILDDMADASVPEATRLVVTALRQRSPQDIEFFGRGVPPQPRAGRLRGRSALRRGRPAGLFHAPGGKPAGGSAATAAAAWPVSVLRIDAGHRSRDRLWEDAGTRYLTCSLCATAWNHVRAVCINCGGSRRVSLKSIEGGSGAIKAEACDDCHTYAKMLYQAEDTKVNPFADDLATLALDVLVAEAGWARHAPRSHADDAVDRTHAYHADDEDRFCQRRPSLHGAMEAARRSRPASSRRRYPARSI